MVVNTVSAAGVSASEAAEIEKRIRNVKTTRETAKSLADAVDEVRVPSTRNNDVVTAVLRDRTNPEFFARFHAEIRRYKDRLTALPRNLSNVRRDTFGSVNHAFETADIEGRAKRLVAQRSRVHEMAALFHRA